MRLRSFTPYRLAMPHRVSPFTTVYTVCAPAVLPPVPDAGEQALVENTESTPVTAEQAVAADYAPMSQVIPEAERLGGPITTYRKKDSLYWELTGSFWKGIQQALFLS